MQLPIGFPEGMFDDDLAQMLGAIRLYPLWAEQKAGREGARRPASGSRSDHPAGTAAASAGRPSWTRIGPARPPRRNWPRLQHRSLVPVARTPRRSATAPRCGRTRPITPLVSPGTRLLASDVKATNRHPPRVPVAAAAIALATARPHAHPPGRARLAVVDEHVVRTVGVAWHQVAGLRVEGDEAPVRRNRRAEAVPLPWAPPELTLTRLVVPVWRSRTKTSYMLLVSPGTRLVASEPKATKRPPAEIAGPTLLYCPGHRLS